MLLAAALCSAAVYAAPVTVLLDSWVSGGQATVRGRVIEALTLRPEQIDDGKRRNMQRTLQLLRQKELRTVPVTVKLAVDPAAAREIISDDEGRFQLQVQTGPLLAGWHALETVPPASGPARVFIPEPRNRYVLLSDVDDTVLFSEVNFKNRLLQHSLMENSLQRSSFAGTAAFYHRLSQLNTVPTLSTWFYLSASPRQLRDPIRQFLQRQGFPDGLLLLKTFAWDGGDPWLDQQLYKTQVLDQLLRDFPSQQFVLLGDDGEHDPEIYRSLEQRHPGRIAAILIRHVHPDPARVRHNGQCDLGAAIEDLSSCATLHALLPD